MCGIQRGVSRVRCHFTRRSDRRRGSVRLSGLRCWSRTVSLVVLQVDHPSLCHCVKVLFRSRQGSELPDQNPRWWEVSSSWNDPVSWETTGEIRPLKCATENKDMGNISSRTLSGKCLQCVVGKKLCVLIPTIHRNDTLNVFSTSRCNHLNQSVPSDIYPLSLFKFEIQPETPSHIPDSYPVLTKC